MDKSTDTYRGTINGITYTFKVSKVGNCCNFNFGCSGTNSIKDPILFTLPLKYRPSLTVRVSGYPIVTIPSSNRDIIIRHDGIVMLSGAEGEVKDSTEVGCGYMTMN